MASLINYNNDVNNSSSALGWRARRLAEALGRGGIKDLSILYSEFLPVHQGLAEGVLDAASWQLLERRLPAIGWWRGWDRCERLRRAAIAVLARHRGCVGRLLREADARTVQYMVKSCLASSEGSALLQAWLASDGPTLP